MTFKTRVQFDADGYLFHVGCGGKIVATVEVLKYDCPVSNGDDSSDFGSFVGFIDEMETSQEDRNWTRLHCKGCGRTVRDDYPFHSLELVTEGEGE